MNTSNEYDVVINHLNDINKTEYDASEMWCAIQEMNNECGEMISREFPFN